MEEEKKDGQETGETEEQGSEGATGEQEQITQPAGVTGGVEGTPEETGTQEKKEVELSDDDKDEKGVTWANRKRELERVHEENEKLRGQLSQVIEYVNSQQRIQGNQATADDPYADVRKVVREEQERILITEAQSTNVMRSALDSLQEKTPRIAEYRKEIETNLISLPANLRSNPNIVVTLAYRCLGEHIDDIATREKNKVIGNKKRLIQSPGSSAEVLSSVSQAGETRIILTEAEKAWAKKHDYDDRSPEQIRRMYNTRQQKLFPKQK